MVGYRWVGVNEDTVPDGGFFSCSKWAVSGQRLPLALGRGLTLVVDPLTLVFLLMFGVVEKNKRFLVAGCLFGFSSSFQRSWLAVLVRAGVTRNK